MYRYDEDDELKFIEVEGEITRVVVNYGGIFLTDIKGNIMQISIEDIKEFIE